MGEAEMRVGIIVTGAAHHFGTSVQKPAWHQLGVDSLVIPKLQFSKRLGR